MSRSESVPRRDPDDIEERDDLDELDDLDDGDDWDDENLDATYLTFRLHDSDYAIGVAKVREIVRLPRFVEVPDVPGYIRGVINLRGHVIPLMDARSRLGLPEGEYSDRTIAIVLESDGVSTGLVADGVNGVAEIPPELVDAPPRSRRRSAGVVRPVTGIARLEDSIAIVLDAALLLGDAAVEPLSDSECLTAAD